MFVILGLAALVFFAIAACKLFQHVGYTDGLEEGFRRGRREGDKAYATTIGSLNVALGSMTLAEIGEALKGEPSTDKVAGLIRYLLAKSNRVGDHLTANLRAVEAEFKL